MPPLPVCPAPPVPSVPRELVHKTNPDEVLLTGWHHTAPDAFAVTARWPDDHPFYEVRHGLHDPLILSETIRQIFPLLSHAVYEVPFGHHLLWDRYRFTLHPDALDAALLPPTVDLHVTCLEVVRRGRRTTALTLLIRAFRGGVPLATAHTRFTIQTPTVYRRLRARYADAHMWPAPQLTLPVRPPRVARTHARDVVLSPSHTPHRHQLRLDPRHAVLFDHPVDHVPGMLLLEAARQAAHHLHHPEPIVPIAMDCQFHRYLELHAPCWIDTRQLPPDALGRARTTFTFHQNNTPHFTTTLTHQRLDSATGTWRG
uniref:A-factor biosynthesis hotdog domain-containing protein n=1 Tax=Streptomyces sp. NBC_00003 TaxID=2903608 RepID=A0AAU2V036_9ACTN